MRLENLASSGENRGRNFYRLGEGQEENSSAHCRNECGGLLKLETWYIPLIPIHTAHWHRYGAVPWPEACTYPYPSGLIAYSFLDKCF